MICKVDASITYYVESKVHTTYTTPSLQLNSMHIRVEHFWRILLATWKKLFYGSLMQFVVSLLWFWLRYEKATSFRRRHKNPSLPKYTWKFEIFAMSFWLFQVFSGSSENKVETRSFTTNWRTNKHWKMLHPNAYTLIHAHVHTHLLYALIRIPLDQMLQFEMTRRKSGICCLVKIFPLHCFVFWLVVIL